MRAALVVSAEMAIIGTTGSAPTIGTRHQRHQRAGAVARDPADHRGDHRESGDERKLEERNVGEVGGQGLGIAVRLGGLQLREDCLIRARRTVANKGKDNVMDLGIAGRKAIVCASSRGLGQACAKALAEAGCEVVVNGRDAARVEATAAELAKATGAKVHAVAADVASAEGQKALFAACPEPDILVNNNAGPPFRDFRELDRAADDRRRRSPTWWSRSS